MDLNEMNCFHCSKMIRASTYVLCKMRKQYIHNNLPSKFNHCTIKVHHQQKNIIENKLIDSSTYSIFNSITWNSFFFPLFGTAMCWKLNHFFLINEWSEYNGREKKITDSYCDVTMERNKLIDRTYFFCLANWCLITFSANHFIHLWPSHFVRILPKQLARRQIKYNVKPSVHTLARCLMCLCECARTRDFITEVQTYVYYIPHCGYEI